MYFRDKPCTVITWDQSNNALGELMNLREARNTSLRISLEKNTSGSIIAMTLKCDDLVSEVDYQGYIVIDHANRFYGITEDQYCDMFQAEYPIDALVNVPDYMGRLDGVSHAAVQEMAVMYEDTYSEETGDMFDEDTKEPKNVETDQVDPKNVKSTLKAYTGKVYLNVQDSESEFKENVIDAEENYDY